MLYKRAAKESVGFYETWTLGGSAFAGLVDISGWTFKASFERFAGDPQAFTLEMAATPTAQGFYIFNASARLVTCRILPAALQAITDTTGNFTLYADLLATPPGAARFSVADLQFTIVRGPTT